MVQSFWRGWNWIQASWMIRMTPADPTEAHPRTFPRPPELNGLSGITAARRVKSADGWHPSGNLLIAAYEG